MPPRPTAVRPFARPSIRRDVGPELAIRLRDMLLRLTAERVNHLSTALAASGA